MRMLFPTLLLAVFVSTWVGGMSAGFLGTAISALVGLMVYASADGGLKLKHIDSVSYILLVCVAGVALVGAARYATDRLRRERRWYEALLDHSMEAIGFVSSDGSLRYLNRSARKLWGVGDEVIGQPATVVLQMRRMEQAFELDPRAPGKRGATVRRLPDGLSALQRDEWIAVTGSGTWIKRGQAGEGVVFSLQWDEALRNTTTQLQATRQRLDALLDADVVGVAVIEVDGRISYLNRAFYTMLGADEVEADLSALRLADLLIDEDGQLTGEQVACRDMRIRRMDGSSIWASVTFAPSTGLEGLLLATRIDDRKRAEEEANFRRMLLQSIIDEVPALIAFIDRAGSASVANSHVRALLQVEGSDTRLQSCLAAPIWAQMQPDFERACAGESPRRQLRVTGSAGEERCLESVLTPYRSDAGEVEGVIWHAFDVTERMLRERSLSESEYRFRRLAKTFSSVVWQATEDGRLISDFGWSDYTGLPSVQTMRGWADALHPADTAALNEFLDELPFADGRRDLEVRMRHRSGGYRHVALKGIPLRDGYEQPRRWIGCVRDIHTRKTFASALAAREAELRLILETVPVRLAYLDPANVFQWCNRAFAEWLDVSPDMHGVPMEEVLVPEVLAPLLAPLQKAQGGKMASVEWTYSHPILGQRWSSTTFTPDVETDGRVRGVITLCVDCTDRYEREANLRRSVAEHQALVENVPHMVWIADPAGGVEYFNHRWYEYTLACESDSWTTAIHPDEQAEAAAAFAVARATGSELNIEVRYRRGSDDSFRWHLVRATPLRRDDGSIIRWYGTCTDIEDQKAAQETLRQAQSRTDQFLATLSHELRNPLAALVANAHMLDHRDAAGARQSEASTSILRQATHLKRLVDDLLDISRITAGKVRLNTQVFDLGALCADACRDFEQLSVGQGVQLVCSCPIGELYIEGDPARIRQCVDNLISNAIKASFEGGDVRISVGAEAAGTVVIRVEDDGIGIPTDLMRGIFDPFSQGDDWRRNGLGLGLSIVRKMIELHGGTVHVASDGPGCGSVFSLRLPHDPALAMAAQPEQARPSREAARKGRVMIIDDEQDNARALQYLLELEGHEVHIESDGTAGVRHSLCFKPQIVVCDIGLPPPMDGLQVAQRLNECLDWPVHLIAYSGFGTQQDVERSLAGGFHAHLTKPCSPGALLAEIDRGLKRLEASA